MSTSMDLQILEQYQLQYESLQASNEPEWLKKRRMFAFEQFAAQGIPDTRCELWKYTPLRLWQKQRFYLRPKIEKMIQMHEIQLFSMLDEQVHAVVLVDGVYHPELNTHQLQDIIITDYAQAIEKHADKIASYFGQALQLAQHPFASLCEALAQTGMVVIIPDNTVVEQPIHLLFVSSSNSQNGVNHLRNLVIVGKNSQVKIIEHYVNLEDVVYFNNSVTEIILEDNAKLAHYQIEQEGNQSFHIGASQVKQAQGSSYQSYAVTLSGHFSRYDINTDLVAPLAHCQLNGLYFTRNNQHVDYHTQIAHHAPHCTSESLYKGILANRSVSVFNGKVVVHVGAQKTQSKQANHNLLLSAQCEANSKPELEIYADDVKCAHGATTGQLDEEALFFLQSRGIALSKARRMLIRAFANELINQMPALCVRNYCQSYLEMAAYE